MKQNVSSEKMFSAAL